MTWSAYVVGALLLLYVIACLPAWFKKPNPVIFSSVDFVACGCFLLMVDLVNHGGWFLPFAFPVTGVAMLITVTVIALCHYVRKGYLYIFGGAFIALGGFSVLIELMLDVTFGIGMFNWSIYPLVVGFIVGMWLIIVAICKPIRESLRKKFFI